MSGPKVTRLYKYQMVEDTVMVGHCVLHRVAAVFHCAIAVVVYGVAIVIVTFASQSVVLVVIAVGRRNTGGR